MGMYFSFFGVALPGLLKVRWLGVLGWMTADSAVARFRRWQYEKARPERRAAAKKQAEPTAVSWNNVKAAKIRKTS